MAQGNLCVICGAAVAKTAHFGPVSKYCSEACRSIVKGARYARERMALPPRVAACVVCGGEVTASRHKAGTLARTCSDECRRTRARAKQAAWDKTPKGAEKIARYEERRRNADEATKEEMRRRGREEARRRRKADPELAREKDRQRNLTPKRIGYERRRSLQRFGLTPEQYDAMLAGQGGVCAICGGAEAKGRGSVLQVDHDHGTGAIRGLLCSPCNTALGLLREDPAILGAALRYILAHVGAIREVG